MIRKPPPPPGTTINIYSQMVSRNLADPTYEVDQFGYAVALHPQARSYAGGQLFRTETPLVVPRPPKVALDRTAAPGDPQSGYTVGG